MRHHILCICLFFFTAEFCLAAQDQLLDDDGLTTQQFSPKELKEDFAQLYQSLQRAHINLYANTDKQSYDRTYKSTYDSFRTPLSALHAQIIFQKFVAIGAVAHANIAFPNDAYKAYRDNDGTAFPIYVKIVNGQWYVDEDYSSYKLKKGVEILELQGKRVPDVLSLLKRYISADTDEIAASLLEFQLPQYLWLESIDKQTPITKFDLTIRRNNKTETITVKPISLTKLQLRAANLKSESESESERQSNEQENSKEMSAEAGSSDELRSFSIRKNNIAYLKPGPFYNAEEPSKTWDNTQFTQFIDKAFTHFNDNNCRQLIIDLRKNPGGDNSFSDHMVAWYADKPFKFASKFLIKSSQEAAQSNANRLSSSNATEDDTSFKLAKKFSATPFGKSFEFELSLIKPHGKKKFSGEVTVLIDRHSYSNAASVAAITQDYGFGAVAGEPTTDFATTYGSMETFSLANTDIKVGFPKSHIIRPSGDEQAGPVIPDVILRQNINDPDDAMVTELLNRLKGKT